MISEDIKRAYAVYNLLDPEMKKVASEIAAKYPYNTEHVARIIVVNGFSKEEAEKYIRRELILGKAGL